MQLIGLKNFAVVVLSVLAAWACKNDRYNDTDIIPFVPVNFQINLDNALYAGLKNPAKNYAYVADEGVRGVLIYRVPGTNTYRAFERNSPYQPSRECAIVSFNEITVQIVDSCSMSVFDTEGNPISGPSVRPLKRYNTNLDGTFLFISN